MPEHRWATPEEWYRSLDDETRKIADQKIALLKKHNAHDPLSWVSAEMRENVPHVAVFLFLHHVRSRASGSRLFAIPYYEEFFEKSLSPTERMEAGKEAFDRLIKSGANREDLVRVARAGASEATLAFIEVLDGFSLSEEELDAWDDQDFEELEELHNAPAWALAEAILENGIQKLTGRVLKGLHESINDLYPEDR